MAKLIDLEDIKKATVTISPFVRRTPLIFSDSLSKLIGKQLYFKAECLQRTGSFKARGAANAIKPLEGQKIGGILAFSSGNHGQACAYVAGRLGIPAWIIVPQGTPEVKKAAMRGYGAEILQFTFTKTEEIIETIDSETKKRGLVFIHPFDSPLVCAGHGTIGLEILLDLIDADIVMVPVGGGLFVSGVATALKLAGSKAKVYAVGPADACIMELCFREKRLVQMPINERINSTIAESLRTPFTTELAVEQTLKYVDGVVTVTDEELVQAMKLLWTRLKLVVEPGGSAGFAAVLAGKVSIPEGAKVVSVLSGGNVDLVHTMEHLAK